MTSLFNTMYVALPPAPPCLYIHLHLHPHAHSRLRRPRAHRSVRVRRAPCRRSKASPRAAAASLWIWRPTSSRCWRARPAPKTLGAGPSRTTIGRAACLPRFGTRWQASRGRGVAGPHGGNGKMEARARRRRRNGDRRAGGRRRRRRCVSAAWTIRPRPGRSVARALMRPYWSFWRAGRRRACTDTDDTARNAMDTKS